MPPLERADPFGVDAELARGVDAADQGTHGGAGDGADAVAVFEQPVNDADMRKAAGAAAAKN